MLQNSISNSWKKILNQELNSELLIQIEQFLILEKQANKKIFPNENLIFNAFNLCPPENLKLIILGQDPYHNPNQANGLSFSVNKGIKLPPSLKNILKEIQEDTGESVDFNNGDLSYLSNQGVLLLNAVLTVQESMPTSHANIGWEILTDSIIKNISINFNHLVFLLWGKFAQSKESLINTNKHLVLKAAHPSPFSAYNGFFGCKHFTASNQYLIQHNIKPIKWSNQ